ncbi:MAG: hypothetical protein H6708_27365 [Kofleriaceae bacterium]|nr:hypothetical protein [Kofleriaceae bacterium]
MESCDGIIRRESEREHGAAGAAAFIPEEGNMRKRVAIESTARTVGVLLLATLFLSPPAAQADDESTEHEEPAPGPVSEDSDPPPMGAEAVEPGHEPFTPYPADEGSLTWNDYSEAERAALEATQQWAETQSGVDVHNAFSSAVRTTDAQRQAEDARRASGLVGLDRIGVVE